MALPNLASELSDARERLARLEAHASLQDRLTEERHQKVLATLKELELRAADSDQRHWRLTASLIALAAGGGAGVAQIFSGVIGG